ncbi:HD-GYP domain-containing protein [Sporosarcina sp. 179-K 3D1 HS]|uniref:HD-GYP domain-containing protein n=1 Tax=Sporosarcina sp. 179-K 3D1 HS TaxID=3232169 RepID=UPI00399F35E3
MSAVNSDKNRSSHLLGQQTIKNISDENGLLLISASTILRREHLTLLESHHVKLDEQDVRSVVPYHDSQYGECSQIIDESVIQIQNLFDEVRYSQKVPIMEIRDQIIPSVIKMTESPNLFELFASLQAKDDYLYRHNIAVGIIATLIGKWLNLDRAELLQLTTAATLHDIGKMRIPIEILNKPGKLTPQEFEVMKKHTIYGYEMIRKTVGTGHRQALVALQHHERLDGSGYPFGIRNEKIDLFGRIVAVADVFHAMTSKRVYHEPSTFYETLREMNSDAFGLLDPKIVQRFIEKIMQRLIGNDVILSDGRKGKIVMIKPHDPMYPLVKVEENFLDLSEKLSVNIQQVIS